jgi:tRNA modification GTPase
VDVDTIAAVSTAQGPGGIAVVRISGPGAFTVLEGVTEGAGRNLPPRTSHVASIVDPDDGSAIDRAVVTRFVGPVSYTGEDVAEISCHGGRLIPELVLDACVRAGARVAEAGEFTKRAYLRGKLDLAQAEAVADMISARSRAMHRAALHQLERGLSDRVGSLRSRLVHLEALLAHHIDFPEEDDAPVPLERVCLEADEVVRALESLLRTAPEGELLHEGALTVLAGRPNAGKSSLFNVLLGIERSIVDPHPGTTRDALEATAELGGFPFRLVDTAGIREPGEAVERKGIEVARRYVDAADIVLLCVPADRGPSEDDVRFVEGLEGKPAVVIVETKSDLARSPEGEGAEDAERRILRAGPSVIEGTVRVSAANGAGLDELRHVLPQLVYSTVLVARGEVPVITRRRHARALEIAHGEVRAFGEALTDGLPPEVAAAHLRTAESCLEEILGVVSVEDVLEVVFSEFCVGK